MSFGLGILAGIGRGQRAFNDRAYEENLASERSKNEAAVKLYQDFMLRDDVSPETRSAALHAFTQHAQVKGMPTAKDRQAGMDLILGAFGMPREFVSPQVAATRQQGVRDSSIGEGMIGAATGGNHLFPSIPAFGPAGMEMTKRGAQENATPSETRRGFYRSDELAAMRGRAAQIEMNALIGSSGDDGNASSPDASRNNLTALPNFHFDAKGRPVVGMTTRLIMPQQKNYSVGGKTVFGVFDPGSQRIHDRSGNDITEQVDAVEGQQGVRWVQAFNPETQTAEWQALSRIASPGTVGPRVPVPQQLGTTTDEAGNIITTTRDKFTGRISAPGEQIGTQTNVTLKRRNLEASLNLKGLDARQKENAIQLGSLRAYGTYTDGTFPSWMQVDDNGTPIPLAVSPGARPTATGQNKAQAAALGLHIIGRIEPLVARLESQFGPISGRVRDWVVQHGIENNPDVKDLQILTTHLSASLPAIQQFRSGVIMRDYHAVLGGLGQPFENFKGGLASTKEVLNAAFDEGVRPVTPRTTSTRVPTGPGGGTDPTLEALRALAAKIGARP